MSEALDPSKIDWSKCQPMDEGWEYFLTICDQVCAEQPDCSHHFVARIVKVGVEYHVTCRCGCTYTIRHEDA